MVIIEMKHYAFIFSVYNVSSCLQMLNFIGTLYMNEPNQLEKLVISANAYIIKRIKMVHIIYIYITYMLYYYYYYRTSNGHSKYGA